MERKFLVLPSLLFQLLFHWWISELDPPVTAFIKMARGNGRMVMRRRGPRTGANLWSIAYDLVRAARGNGNTITSWNNRIRQLEAPRRKLKRPHPKAGGTKRVWKRARVSRPLRYFTNGYSSSKFAKAKKSSFSPSEWLRRGVTYVTESGGVLTSTDCAYVGHAIVMDDILLTWCVQVVKMLCNKLGKDVVSVTEKFGVPNSTTGHTPGTLRWSYRDSADGKVIWVGYTISADIAILSVATELRQSIWDTLRTALSPTTDNTFEVLEVGISSSSYNGATNSVAEVYATVNCVNYLVAHRVKSKLTLQNRTIAKSSAGQDETSALDVANNPVGGYQYFSKGNGLSLKFTSKQTGTIPELIADAGNGVITMDGVDGNFDSATKNLYKRPPPPQSFQGAVKYSGVKLQPGEIKVSKWTKEVMMYNRTFWSVFFNAFQGRAQTTPVEPPFVKYMCSRVFAFEKHCNTRVDEPDISVGWEISTSTSCILKKKQTIVQPYFNTS